MSEEGIQIQPVLYGPQSGKSLLKTYPSLSDEPLLKNLSKDEIYFAWLIGIKGSPISENLTDEIRYATAAHQVFGNYRDQDKRKMYGRFSTLPEEIKAAIGVFQKFNPDLRLKAKAMQQMAFENYEKLVGVDVDTAFKIKKKVKNPETDQMETIEEEDYSARKQYIDSTATIIKALPEMVKQMEEGFGITEKTSEKTTGKRSIDNFHDRNRDNN